MSDGFEKRLRAKLVEALAMDLAMPYQPAIAPGGEYYIEKPRDPAHGEAGRIVSHDYIGYREKAFRILSPFKIFEPIDCNSRPLPPETFSVSFRLLINVDQAAEHVLRTIECAQPSIDDLLTAFIGLAADRSTLPTTRERFIPRPEYVALLGALAAAGYLGQVGPYFIWSDKAKAAMLGAYMWRLDDGGGIVSMADEEADEVERMWTTMPADAKRRYFLDRGADVLGFAAYHGECWQDDRWTASAPKRRPCEIVFRGGIAYARKIEERFIAPHRK